MMLSPDSGHLHPPAEYKPGYPGECERRAERPAGTFEALEREALEAALRARWGAL
jgi:hypothetical protein